MRCCRYVRLDLRVAELECAVYRQVSDKKGLIMAQGKALNPDEQVIVRNIDELQKSIPKQGKLLIHLTKAQWAGLTKGIRFGKTLPKHGVVFRCTPLPDDNGVIGSLECIPGICEICSSRLGRNPDGGIGIQCRCQRDPLCPPDPPTGHPPAAGGCQLVFRLQGGSWRMTCDRVNCSRACRIVGVRQQNVNLIICACQ